jgi:hypothetical protein
MDGSINWASEQAQNLLDLFSQSLIGALGPDMALMEKYFPFLKTGYQIFLWRLLSLLFSEG